jgi:AcrR family transcriptional regulator
MPNSNAEKRGRRPEQLPAGRHGLTRRDVARSQRERILAAVAEAVAEEGYQGARVTDVIARAGVSRKTFYEHFADKEEAFLAAYDRALAQLMAITQEAFDGPEEWPDRAREALRAFLDALAADPARARMAIVEVLAAGPRALARREAAIRGFTYFVDAGRADAPRGLPSFTALAILGGINEILYAHLLRDAAADLPDLLPDLVYTVTLPFLGHERAREERERSRGIHAHPRAP